MTKTTPSAVLAVIFGAVGVTIVVLDPFPQTIVAGAFLAGAGLLLGYNLPPSPERVEDDEPRQNTGYGEGDLRVIQWVEAAAVDDMIAGALIQHGFTVAHVSVKETWYGRRGRFSGLAMVSLDTPDEEFLTEVQFDVTTTHDHGEKDFSEIGVSVFIPPGWKRALYGEEAA